MVSGVYTPAATAQLKPCEVDFDRRDIGLPVHLMQYDRTMPILAASLYKDGAPFAVPAGAAVNVRLDKKDGHYVYNPALGLTTDRKTVYVGITVQMTAAYGQLPAVLEIALGAEIACSGYLTLDVGRNPAQDGAIESSNEFKTVQQLVIEAAESAAAAKKSQEAAAASEKNAKASEAAAKTSETNAKASENAAKKSENAAKKSESAAKTSETNAKASETAAAKSETNAKASETAAGNSEAAAGKSASAAVKSETNAKTSETAAKKSEEAAGKSATAAKSSETAAKGSAEAAAKSEENILHTERTVKETAYEVLKAAEGVKDTAEDALKYAQHSRGTVLHEGVFLADAWEKTTEDGYAFKQTAALTADTPNARAIKEDTLFVSGPFAEGTGNAAADNDILEALSIINDGKAYSGDGVMTVLVREKPTVDVTVGWQTLSKEPDPFWPDGSGGAGTAFHIGDGLLLDEDSNTLSVNLAKDVAKDDARPVTGGAVYAIIGELETALAAI